jgi:AcrR family transcriptional regulator
MKQLVRYIVANMTGTAGAKASTRTRIMRVAARLLASSVDGQLSTREICRGAAVTAPTLYHHFKDKEALLDEVVLEGFQNYLTKKREIADSGDPVEELRRGWDMHVTFGCEYPGHYRLMFGNPRTEYTPPAAQLAHKELLRVVGEWERAGRLLVPIDVATSTLYAAAIGTTLQMIALRADCAHPRSISVRDTIAGALISPAAADQESVARVGRPARMLLDVLPHGQLGPLRPTETALLREWLNAISERSAE